ncbi:hypothetical protein PsAD2_03748 [Pseudovibrio axinellae]|uniref:Uncharacterized protein n=1 Tax=Pseudovibrio axinellae TaxID=989403 RepID=A0A165VMA9_9HYPH|nr:hypothetical protein PsAD2_03748 [Pseudovibrio axinellae]
MAGSDLLEVGPRFPLSTVCLEFTPKLRMGKAICVFTQQMQQSLSAALIEAQDYPFDERQGQLLR